jgi:hypothetical protein
MSNMIRQIMALFDEDRRDHLRALAVCTENLSSGVVVVKSAKDGV